MIVAKYNDLDIDRYSEMNALADMTGTGARQERARALKTATTDSSYIWDLPAAQRIRMTPTTSDTIG